jgi:hypothetical protein
MNKEDERRQIKINKIGARFEKKIADMITSVKPATEEALVAAMAALASSIVQIAIARFGKEKAPGIISVAINNALKRTAEHIKKGKQDE